MLKNQVIVITGGAGLLGQAFVKAVVENNGIAIIADFNEEAGIEAKNELSKELKTKNIDFIKLDITSLDSLENCITYLEGKYERIDALVNNAYPRNKNYGKNFFDVTYDDFVENVGLNLGGYFLASQQFGRHFMKNKSGNIINISSVYGSIAPRFEIYSETEMSMPIEYAAIKSGLIQLTKYMSKYFAGNNIKVNSISPGGILNNQPSSFLGKYNKYANSKGMLDAADLNGTLIYLLSNMSQYMNGQNLIVDDGWSL